MGIIKIDSAIFLIPNISENWNLPITNINRADDIVAIESIEIVFGF
jgi:hypothetical protein